MVIPDFTNAALKKVITHLVGNKSREEGFVLTESLSQINGDSLLYLQQYFLEQFQTHEYYSFHHPVDIELNEIFVLASKIFADKSQFKEESNNFTKLLYDCSLHPKIKNGELNVALFDEILVDDEIVEAIGIYKSENNVPFISMDKAEENSAYSLQHQYGYELKGIDKGCLILNTAKEDGYAVLIVDKVSGDAQYWINDFLKVKAVNNDFTETRTFMDMTKTFLTKKLEKETSLDNTERIDLLNKTVDYFKNNERYDKDEFENSVLQEQEVIESFRSFTPTYSEENEIELSDSFDISDQAVKKQVRKFKRVLKLDKNFQIYIQGDKSLINKGVETDGRKFYKIYYENEA